MKTSSRETSLLGFTLLELLIVIAIITILLTILTPAIGGAIARAQDTKCRSNLKVLHNAMILHATSHNGQLPGGAFTHVIGTKAEDKAWVGKEVLGPLEKFSDYDPDGGWKPSTRNDGYGTLLDIIGLKGKNSAKNLYRCPALEVGEPNSGIGSNGILDYTMPFIWNGADVERVPADCVIYRGDSALERKMPAPLLLEEDTEFYLNNNWREPGFNAGDRLGMHHDSHGNYVSIDGAVHHARFPNLGPQAFRFEVQTIKGAWLRYQAYGFGGFNNY